MTVGKYLSTIGKLVPRCPNWAAFIPPQWIYHWKSTFDLGPEEFPTHLLENIH